MVSSAVYAVFKELSEPRRSVAILAMSVFQSSIGEGARRVELAEKETGSGVEMASGDSETLLSWR